MPSRRRLARVAVMQTVFEMQMRPIEAESSLQRNIDEFGGAGQVDSPFAGKLFQGVKENWEKIRTSIESHAPEWPLERMDTITRSILMLGAYELLFAKDAPPAVVMNEAIEVAKEYGTEESAKFVNGVLNALAHRDDGKQVG
ncbi:transcription antitermination factor NusB [Candidatus Peribacteria bacterium RIFCSPLOWO2_01_FULL_51_18]|nr:MAG: transcription antitermination factor NusB [Candidatus Peribacteria bacterium RIFCSPHIGHO2_02_FULL_51_15]OGJ66767.1 MAG: transcription antitermination factor NusB [Candidatus Peribacteria bacterium RIFCSPLOWO2_01_FULL_51_18]OGJ67215.1 MAG: transcription antitermination factor NusB [Candidatus Peribacteria bacterium RIFCSPLOWO2_02_FULL_51_10]